MKTQIPTKHKKEYAAWKEGMKEASLRLKAWKTEFLRKKQEEWKISKACRRYGD